ALVDDGGLRAERTLVGRARALEWLAPAIEDMLGESDLGQEAVEGVAVSVGPGSFTGLRIGIATAQAWARGRDLPACGVPTLEAMAAAMEGADAVVPVLDARRGEVAAALFARRDHGWVRAVEEVTAPPEQILVRFSACGIDLRGLVLTGDGLLAYGDLFTAALPGARIAERVLWAPRAATVAAVGRSRILQGGESLYSIQPRYGRSPALRAAGVG
ncbi:MAG: tRNA (adenosine(37)-N6)-threonylcarbamoyltransferase complex dimerization subunit type 1 TsaB, partial [Armatimonadota bacterium]|nr:tRNA (adenosine(37)-N6)-threonylcarbamoyltransferase complex dimerization subunit type 1 TsaB [Armatimonadota bacterium]